MKTKRSITHSKLSIAALSLILCTSWTAHSGTIAGDTTVTGQLTLQPPLHDVMLELRSSAFGAYGGRLTLSYHDWTTGTPTGLFNISDSYGVYQWQFGNPTNGTHLAMELDSSHSLSIRDSQGYLGFSISPGA